MGSDRAHPFPSHHEHTVAQTSMRSHTDSNTHIHLEINLPKRRGNEIDLPKKQHPRLTPDLLHTYTPTQTHILKFCDPKNGLLPFFLGLHCPTLLVARCGHVTEFPLSHREMCTISRTSA